MKLLDKKLEIFRMAAELNHFSEAAAALGMTQPNVTHQIALLEQEFGTALFERDGRRLHLTAAGAALHRECLRLFDDVDQIARHVRNAADSVAHYTIGGTMTAGGYLLPGLAARYMKHHPRQILSLHVANTDEISAMLKTRKLELGLVEGPFDRKLFLNEVFFEEAMHPIAAPGILPEHFSLADYIQSNGKFVLRESGSGTRWHFDRFRKEHELPPIPADNIMVANSFDAIKNLIRGGYGITVLSPLAARDEIAAGQLKLSRFSEGEIRRGMNFIYLPNENLKFIQTFITFCQHHKASLLLS